MNDKEILVTYRSDQALETLSEAERMLRDCLIKDFQKCSIFCSIKGRNAIIEN
jgi:hypothetical protein